jgi:hypothetical protein
MVNFVMWVIFIGVGICMAVLTTIAVLIIVEVVDSLRKHSLPSPDKAAERMYGQQYFGRVMNKK